MSNITDIVSHAMSLAQNTPVKEMLWMSYSRW